MKNTSCRRKSILEYLGESFSKPNCNGCDICKDSIRITEPTPRIKLVHEKVKKVLKSG